jgi:hypothetical protein
MNSDHITLERLRAFPTRRSWLLWLLVFVALLKAAVPLLVASSARERGVSLVEICSVYGVRTVADDPVSDSPAPMQSEHASSQDCALTPLLGAAVLIAPTPAAVDRHAPARLHFAAPAEPLPPRDASFAWLASRTHAPPLTV